MSEQNEPKIIQASANVVIKNPLALGIGKAGLDQTQERLKRQVSDISDSLEFLFEKIEVLESKVEELAKTVDTLSQSKVS